jgi:hypothetical protein
MEMPKPLEEHRRLEKLAGTWTGEETIFPSPWDAAGGPATGTFEARLACDGFWLVADYAETRNGQVSYLGHGVYGYDRKEQAYTMSWFDSMTESVASVAKGRWDGNRLVFANQTPMGHSRFTYEFQGEGRYRFLIENSQDGKQWVRMMEGQYTRR